MTEPMAHVTYPASSTPKRDGIQSSSGMNGSYDGHHDINNFDNKVSNGDVRPWPTPPSTYMTSPPLQSIPSLTDSPTLTAAPTTASSHAMNGRGRAVPFKNPFQLSFERSFSEDEQRQPSSPSASSHNIDEADARNSNNNDNNNNSGMNGGNGNDELSRAARIAATRKMMLAHARSRSAFDLSADLDLEIGTGPEGTRRVKESRSRYDHSQSVHSSYYIFRILMVGLESDGQIVICQHGLHEYCYHAIL
jgi:hypothetical protein